MRTYRSVRLPPPNATAVVVAASLFTIGIIAGTAASAFEDEEWAPSEAGAPAEITPGETELPSLEMPPADQIAPRKLDRGMFRPELRDDLEGAAPLPSPDDQDQIVLSPFDVPLPSPEDKPKVLGELYVKLGEAKDAESAQPIMVIIERLWRATGSDTVDLLLNRAARFTKEPDLDLAGEILDATVAIAPDEAEAWYLRAKVHYLKAEYQLALDDLKHAIDRDARHYRALEDLGLVFEALGTKKDALEAYRKALEVNPFLDNATEAVRFLSREVGSRDL
jgi:tetratricopeptide (TPR) repeat protein